MSCVNTAALAREGGREGGGEGVGEEEEEEEKVCALAATAAKNTLPTSSAASLDVQFVVLPRVFGALLLLFFFPLSFFPFDPPSPELTRSVGGGELGVIINLLMPANAPSHAHDPLFISLEAERESVPALPPRPRRHIHLTAALQLRVNIYDL